MDKAKLLLIGCGILEKEIRWLIEKNRWPVESIFLTSALHVDFEKLSHCLTSALDTYQDRNRIVFYGCCHPLMHTMLEEADVFRTPGQNCIDILLGHTVFTEELGKGAFFLLEDWAQHWRSILPPTFGNNPKGISYIFQFSHTYILGLRTPCSADFCVEAEEFAEITGLPLRWMDVSLDHLEAILQKTITRKERTIPCRT